MKLIHPSYEIIEQGPGLQGIYEQIEKAGRTCYKSEDKITEGSAERFVNAMVKSGHGAMLEHGTVYLYIPVDDSDYTFINAKYSENPYSKVNGSFVTTNMRVLVENEWLDDLQYLCEPTEYHEKRITVKFVCDRGVSHELVRHKILCVA